MKLLFTAFRKRYTEKCMDFFQSLLTLAIQQFIIISILIFPSEINAQELTNVPFYGEITTKAKKNKTLYGYKYKDKQVLRNKYQEISAFSGGIASIKFKGKWGFIDKRGEVLVKPKYDKVIMMQNFSAAWSDKDSIWRIVNDDGIKPDMNNQFTDMKELPFGYALASLKDENKKRLLSGNGYQIIRNVDSVQLFKNEQLLVFLSLHQNCKEISPHEGTDSIPLFSFQPDFVRFNYEKSDDAWYFKYVDHIFEMNDSVVLLPSFFCNTTFLYDPKKPFKEAKRGEVARLRGDSYVLSVPDKEAKYSLKKFKSLVIKKDGYFEPVAPMQKSDIKAVNDFVLVTNYRSWTGTAYDLNGKRLADNIDELEALNDKLTLFKINRDIEKHFQSRYYLYGGSERLAETALEPKLCNNDFYMVVPNTRSNQYFFVNQEGSIVGDTFDLFFEIHTSYSPLRTFVKFISGIAFFELFTGEILSNENTRESVRFFDRFHYDSIVGNQVIVTKILPDKSHYVFGTMLESGELNIPLKYLYLKHIKNWGYIFAISKNEEYRFGLMDWNGEERIPPIYSSMLYKSDVSGGALKVTKNDRTFYIDKYGKELLPSNTSPNPN